MPVPMKLLLIDPLDNKYGNGLVSIRKMESELVDFPEQWECGISDKTGTSAMQSLVIYKDTAYYIVKNYYDMDKNVRIFMCMKSRDTFDDLSLYEEKLKADAVGEEKYKKDHLVDDASVNIFAAIREHDLNCYEGDLSRAVFRELGRINNDGYLNMNACRPNEVGEIAKVQDYLTSVEQGEWANSRSITVYTLTQDLDLTTGLGEAYEVTTDTLDNLTTTKTKSFIEEQTEAAKSYSADAKVFFGGAARQVNGKVYVGWAVRVFLPEVQAANKTPSSSSGSDSGDNDVSFGDL